MNGEVQAIDWGAPIEAYHSDGNVTPAHRMREGPAWPDSDGQYHVATDAPGTFWNSDGSSWEGSSDWRIRNVSTPPQTPDVSPEVVTLTGEQVDMLRKVLAWVKAAPGPFADEAAACLDLMEPIDPDLVEARNICADVTGEDAHEQRGFISGDFDKGEIMLCALAAIRRGRELQSAPPKQGR